MITDGRAKGQWPKGNKIWAGVMPSLVGVRSPPFPGGPIQFGMAFPVLTLFHLFLDKVVGCR